MDMQATRGPMYTFMGSNSVIFIFSFSKVGRWLQSGTGAGSRELSVPEHPTNDNIGRACFTFRRCRSWLFGYFFLSLAIPFSFFLSLRDGSI